MKKLRQIVSLPVKALTISQPYASLIASGEKWVENRRWATNYRGPIAIHAGRGTQYLSSSKLGEYPHGGIIAAGELTACVDLNWDGLDEDIVQQELDGTELTVLDLIDHQYTEGPYCWIIQNVIQCHFVSCSGRQGLWEFRR